MADIEYLDRAAATEPGGAYKHNLLVALEIRAGYTVLDVGCGPATDLLDLATAVGSAGRVIGVDHDPAMVDEAVRRTTAHPGIEIRPGDAHELPVETSGVDRARADRVLMHVHSPTSVLGELHRVVRPGGLIGLVEPDWDTLVIDAEDLATSRAYTRYVVGDVVRNATIGRQLARLATGAGFTVLRVDAATVLLTDHAAAEDILKPSSVARRAVDDGAIDADAARSWLAGLAEGPFVAAFTHFTVIARR